MMTSRPTTVFVRLLDEGLNVWRPVPAEPLGGDRFRLLMFDDFDGGTETWEFPRHSVVRCKQQLLGGVRWLVAAESGDTNSL